MFDKQYRFRGSHAERVTKLTSQFESISGTKVFERNVDVLCDAPLIGFLYNRRADLDNTKIRLRTKSITPMSWVIA